VSGGHYQYFYNRVDEFVNELSRNSYTPERRAFLSLMRKISVAVHAIEWVDSSDYSPGDENEYIMECVSQSQVIEAATDHAVKAVDELKTIIDKLTK